MKRFTVCIAALLLGPIALAQQLLVDEFERANLGSNWTVYNGSPGIPNGRDFGVFNKAGALYGLAIAGYTGAAVGANQFSACTLSATYDALANPQVFVRRRVSDKQRYGFFWYQGTWRLKRDGGVAAPVLAAIDGPGPLPGDVLRIEAIGPTLYGLVNGTLLLVAQDSALPGGVPGLVVRVVDVHVFPTAVCAQWNGGSL